MLKIDGSEKDIEDVLEEHSERLLGLKFLCRQFRTKVGIIDIIAKDPINPHIYYVIELKRGTLDSSGYVQVLKYASWMNSEFSKGCARLFLPLLIGESLHQELHHICDYWGGSGSSNHSYDSPSSWLLKESLSPQYRCFSFDPISGVSFNFRSERQLESGYLHLFWNEHFETLGFHIDYLNSKLKEYEKCELEQ
jgi:hypothetical protein